VTNSLTTFTSITATISTTTPKTASPVGGQQDSQNVTVIASTIGVSIVIFGFILFVSYYYRKRVRQRRILKQVWVPAADPKDLNVDTFLKYVRDMKSAVMTQPVRSDPQDIHKLLNIDFKSEP